MDKALRKFWELEEVPSCNPHTNEERYCEEHFQKTHRKHENGKYVVRIPFKEPTPKLGNSLYNATKRFYALERKLNSDLDLKEEYTKVLNNYIESGHMREITYKEMDMREEECFYLPHHAVTKESSSTTKVRVVFDGSSKSSNGTSLNDMMLVGPTIQPSLWTTLVKFRGHKIALSADIEKMYRQVIVAEDDIHFQRILWRENSTQPIKKYVLTTVTFGLASSAFLAIRSLHQAALDNDLQYPEISRKIRDEFYVDDFLSGTDSIEDAKSLKEKINFVLNKNGFCLRKWISNSSQLRDRQVEDKSKVLEIEENEATSKILGIQWDSDKDNFTFKVNLPNEAKSTKRTLISHSSKIFDPLGWLSPSIVIAKILFQKLWLTKLDWDDPLPEDTAKLWNDLKGELVNFQKIQIPRYIPKDGAEIHGFCDASEQAYAAVVYCRSKDENGDVSIMLIASKTKVAPIKQVSLPRLELCGAHLLAKLMKSVREAMKDDLPFHAWTDSEIVLAWLSDHPIKWKTFVANRTAEILDILPRQHWNHVKSDQNPADYASRGVLPSRLIHFAQWWNGPSWLQNDQQLWPTCNNNISKIGEFTGEERKAAINTFHCENDEDIFQILIYKTNSFSKLVRILSFINRFVFNLKIKRAERKKMEFTAEEKIFVNLRKFNNTPNKSVLTVAELNYATTKIIKWVQDLEFKEDIANLKKNKRVSKNSKLLQLAPFIDSHDGLLRVGGRLENAAIDYAAKHPIILPKSHNLCRMIISYTHKKHLHPGPSLTSFLIRQKYWLIGARGIIRDEIKKCIPCFRQKAKTSEQLMGNLPEVRVTPARPFSKCGVDYAGPICIASKRGRGAKIIKGYIAVFVCMSVKAIHLEIVSDLSSEAFIAALKRFSSRRGTPSDIYSDNGTNFIGAKRQLNEVFKLLQSESHNNLIAEYLAQNETQWHPIPVHAPHFGGLWEGAVKSVKTHLTRVTSNCNLTFEEMGTLLCQIEAILNSRPLCAVSEDDTTINALTPAHFLIGSTMSSIPELDLNTIPVSRLSRWQQVQQRARGFWNRYYTEYINNLQQRNKWQHEHENLKVNDLVLIKEDNSPSCMWRLGRIISTNSDENGLVRVVSIKTSSTIIKRPITKVARLPNC